MEPKGPRGLRGPRAIRATRATRATSDTKGPRDIRGPRAPKVTPPRPPKSATTKHNELAAECRRYHAQTQQHSDVLDAQSETYIKTYVFYQRKWSLTAWGLDGSAPTLTKSRACAQK